MTKSISGSFVLAILLCGCSTVTYTPNNSMAISDEKAKEFVDKSAQAKNLNEYANILGYSKHDGYYSFVDKEPYNKATISWRTFASFCKAQGGIIQNDPKFAEIKTTCPIPSFVQPTSKTYTTAITYCKIPAANDATRMSANEILYIFYSRFKGDYPKGGDLIDVIITGDQNTIAPIKSCYNKAYEDSIVYLEKDRAIRQEVQNQNERQYVEHKKAQALEQERQATLAKQKAEEEKRQHEQRLKEIATFRNGKLSEETVTNCGPILEVKKTMVKVYFPVKDYGNEHWIPKNEIFPDGYGCAFTNGQYVGPTYRY